MTFRPFILIAIVILCVVPPSTCLSQVDSLHALDSSKPHISPWLISGIQAVSGCATFAAFFFPFRGDKLLDDPPSVNEGYDPRPDFGLGLAFLTSPLAINLVGNILEHRKGGYWKAFGLGFGGLSVSLWAMDRIGLRRTKFGRYLAIGVVPMFITTALLQLLPNNPIETKPEEGNKLRLNFAPVFSPNRFGLNISGSW